MPSEPNDPADPADDEFVLPELHLELPYIPDFLIDEVRYFFLPSIREPREAYHELLGRGAKSWGSYYTKKGWKYLYEGQAPEEPVEGVGPYRVRAGHTRIDLLPPARLVARKPILRLERGGDPVRLVSLEKHRPLNPWKPNYVRALEFIKRFEWEHALSRRVQSAIWEIEECGEVSETQSWHNSEAILLQSDSEELRATLEALFYNRPEDFPLGSQIYLKVLGSLEEDGFDRLLGLAQHPVSRKRRHVAQALARHRDPRAIATLLEFLDDEDPDVRADALRSLANVGVDSGSDPEGKVAARLEAESPAHRIWATAALVAGGDESQKKVLVTLVKEDPRPLADLGDLGDVLVDLNLFDAVPFLIQRLKSDRREVVLDAADTLHRLTGLDIMVSAQGMGDEKRTAIRAYTRWWDEQKRARNAKRHGRKR